MKIYPWNNKKVTDVDLFIRIEKEEIGNIDKIHPKASSTCKMWDGAYYGFIDTKRKLFIPLRVIAYAFGSQYNGYPPYGEEIKDIKIDLEELKWQEYAKIDKMTSEEKI